MYTATTMLLRSLVFFSFVAVISCQRKFYSLHDMPETNFDCRDKILGGYYADPETNCQMFHVCVKIPGQGVQDFRFLCPNETAFDQENQICADSGDIDCEAAGLYLENFDLYRIGSAPAKRPPLFSSSKGTVVPLGPSTKSPILTNNINEDDEFFLQRSDTGDRRLHSKDLLRGSSSSNFFNNRNKGKDLEDDDEEENIPKTNNEYRPRSNHPVRGKSQYSSQFRKTETTAPPQQSTPQQEIRQNQNQINDKKRTKIAVRKLTRKRPQNPEEGQDTTKTTAQPNFSSFTTQVTQKFNFGEQEQRYNTINRVSTTPSTVSTQNRFQSNFRAKTEPSSSTLAFFEPSPTPKSFAENKNDVNKDIPSVNLQRQPIVAAAAPQNFPNAPNRPATNFQPPFRQTTVVVNPSSNQGFQQNKQTTPAVNVNFNQNRPNPPVNNNNFQQNRPNPPVNNNNFQQNRPNPPVNNNVQQNRPNVPVNNNNNNNFQQRPPVNQQNNFQQNRPTTPGNFQQNRQTPQVTFQPVKQTPPPQQNFQTRHPNQQNFQQLNRSPAPVAPVQNRPTTLSTAVPRAQTINNAFQSTSRPTPSPQNLRQYYNRQFDDFEEGDNQEFLKTAPSSNFRPSDLNSFNKNNFKSSENFDGKNNATKFAPTSTTKYYTPTIVTTPKTSPTFSTKDAPNKFFSTNNPSSFFTPTVTSTTKLFKAPSSTLQPPSSGPQPRPFSTTQNQNQNQPPTTSAKPKESKDASYDYAYYDDAGSFSEYDALDALGETDFTRTSQRTKSRLI